MTGVFLPTLGHARSVTEPTRLPTGCGPVDALLEGGLEVGAITQVYGPPAAGKTNLALAAAVETAANGGRVLCIDAEGLSPERLSQLVESRSDVETTSDVTDRIVIRDVHDFSEQRAAIKEAAEVAEELSLIIVDSLTGFYRLERGQEEENGDALRSVTRQVTHLLALARKHDLAVLVTNQVFMDPEADRIRPLGGNSLGHWSGAVVRLDRFRGGNRRATLEQHRSLPAGDTATFRITDTGLRPAEQLRR